jgi:molybdate transport system substrate-binding protein
MRSLGALPLIAACGFLVAPPLLGAATAAEIKVLCSVGIKAVVTELAPRFEAQTAHKLAVTYDLSANLARQIGAGVPFDVAILTPSLVDDAITRGNISPDSRTVIARSGLAVAIRAGARKPDTATVETFTRTLVQAKSLIYAKEGASGVAFAAIIDRLGIAGALKSKSVLAASGDDVGASVARGDVELGILPLSEILPVRGVEVLGLFPADVQSYIVMVGGTGTKAAQPNVAKDFLKFLTAPAVLSVLKARGMERPGPSS